MSPEVVYVHTEPIPGGYAQRAELRRGEHVPVPYASRALGVDQILG